MTNSPPPVSYASASPRSQHDTIYTAALSAVAFFQLIGLVFLWQIAHAPTAPPEAATSMRLVLTIELLYFLFEIAVLLVRLTLPAYRKWPTVSLNLVLLLFFPFGTALAIYGLWKVDKTQWGK